MKQSSKEYSQNKAKKSVKKEDLKNISGGRAGNLGTGESLQDQDLSDPRFHGLPRNPRNPRT